jgi:hypothetical protein
MTSESDSTSGGVSDRRPPTIELTAMEVGQPKAPPGTANPATEPTTEGPAEAAAKASAQTGAPEQKSSPEQAAPQKPSDPKPAAKAQGGLFLHAVSAVIGAVAAAVVLVGLWLAGFTLARDVVTSQTEGPQAVVPIAANSQITARLDKIEHALATPKPEAPAVPPALANRLAAVEMQAKMLGDSAAALNHHVDDIAATAQAAQKQSTSAASAAADVAKNAGQSGVQPADLDALTSRIAALESAVKALSEQVAHLAASADQAARLAVAAQALQSAVERGAPYEAELKAVQSLGADQSATAPLAAYAATGVPHADVLAHELALLVPALQQATDTSSGDTTFLSKLEANAQRLVRVTPVDATPGDDVTSVIARINIDALRGNIAGALNEIAALPDDAKALAADWVKKAQARESAIAASRHIAADAVEALGKPAAQ